MRHDSTGRRLLMRVLQLHSHTAVARICRVSQPAVTNVDSTKHPSASWFRIAPRYMRGAAPDRGSRAGGPVT